MNYVDYPEQVNQEQAVAEGRVRGYVEPSGGREEDN
jgi:hypothetical protein